VRAIDSVIGENAGGPLTIVVDYGEKGANVPDAEADRGG
jgi:hypothetical protein